MSLVCHVLGNGAAGLAKEEPHRVGFELMLHGLRHIGVDLSLNALQPKHAPALSPLTIAPQSFVDGEVIGIEGPTLALGVVVVLEIKFSTSLDRVRYGGEGGSFDIDLTYITAPRHRVIYEIAYESHTSEN